MKRMLPLVVLLSMSVVSTSNRNRKTTHKIFIKTFVVLLFLFGLSVAAQAQDYLTYLKEDDSLFRAGKYKEAIEPLTKSLELKKTYQGYTFLGYCYDSLDKFQEAAVAYWKSLEIKSEQPTVWHTLTYALWQLKKYDEAVESAKYEVKYAPDKSMSWASLGQSQIYVKNYSESVKAFQKAVEIDPKDANLAKELENAKAWLAWSQTGSTTDEKTANQTKETMTLPEMPGSKWAIKSEGDVIYSMSPALDFYKNGKWYRNNYPNANLGGSYKISGSRLTMYYEDGTVYGDYTMSWDEQNKILTLSGKSVMRLEYDGRSE